MIESHATWILFVTGLALLASLWSCKAKSAEVAEERDAVLSAALPVSPAISDAASTASEANRRACAYSLQPGAAFRGVHASFLVLLLLQGGTAALSDEEPAFLQVAQVLLSAAGTSLSALMVGQRSIRESSQAHLDLGFTGVVLVIGCLLLSMRNIELFFLMSGLSSTMVSCMGAVCASVQLSAFALWCLWLVKMLLLLRFIPAASSVPDDEALGSKSLLAAFVVMLECGVLFWNMLILVHLKRLMQMPPAASDSLPRATIIGNSDLEYGRRKPVEASLVADQFSAGCSEASTQTESADLPSHCVSSSDGLSDHACARHGEQTWDLSATACGPPASTPREHVLLRTAEVVRHVLHTEDADASNTARPNERRQQPVHADATLELPKAGFAVDGAWKEAVAWNPLFSDPAVDAGLGHTCHVQSVSGELAASTGSCHSDRVHSEEVGAKVCIGRQEPGSGIHTAPAVAAGSCCHKCAMPVSVAPGCASCISLQRSVAKLQTCTITVDASTDDMVVAGIQVTWRRPCGDSDDNELEKLLSLVDPDESPRLQAWLSKSIPKLMAGSRPSTLQDLCLHLPMLGEIVAARAHLRLIVPDEAIEAASSRFYIKLESVHARRAQEGEPVAGMSAFGTRNRCPEEALTDS
eukprot:TRINITY_DN7540_c0_g3_i3.p1 TRINITY_DN7540_c0_g3~~TRINITY_DN7540_c0_g3_i3.p1  ORF type:complete len:640 (-),score=70.99 TRINITY_DN7540_c0_g3_i3:358-2277(-)